MKIRQLVLIVILILSLISFLAPSLFAAEIKQDGKMGDFDENNAQIQAIYSIPAENPGILQTNPFYFVKEWRRGIHRVFIFNPIAKLQYDFQVSADKSAELKRLEEIGVVDGIKLRAALSNYADSLKFLAPRLRALDISGVSGKSQWTEILSDFTSQALKQEQLLEELKSRQAGLKTYVEATQAHLFQIVEVASARK